MIFLSNPEKKIREKMQEALELPKELLKEYSRMTILGGEDVWIENYQSMMEYNDNYIRFSNHIAIYGDDLKVEEICEDDVLIVGKIKQIEFE